MKSFKNIIYFLSWVILLGFSQFTNAQNCEGFTATAVLDDTSPFCCFSLEITNTSANEFVDLRITPVSNVEFDNTVFATDWNFSSNTSTEIRTFPAAGFIPTGTFQPLSFCLVNYNSAPQQILIELINLEGFVCEQIVTLSCPRCIDIDYDDLVCDENNQGSYLFNFNYTNIDDFAIARLEINSINPPGSTFSPTALFFNPTIAPGQTASGTFSFTPPAGTTALNFTIRAIGIDDCCICTSDEITVDVPECEEICTAPCENISVTLNPESIEEQYCCYSIDLENNCDSLLFRSIKLQVLGNFFFRSQSTSSGWEVINATPTSATWQPRAILNPSPYIPKGSIMDKINFCLGGIENPADVPQQIRLSWLGANGQTICDTILITECEPLVPGDCVIVLDDDIACNDNGTYTYTWSLENVGNFKATSIKILNTHTVPSGGTMAFAPTTISGISFAVGNTRVMPTMTISGLQPGEEACFQVSLYDSVDTNDPNNGSNNCCHTDTICIVMPECPGCDDPCEGISYTINTDDSELCCHSIDIEVECEETFAGIELEVLGGSTFMSASSPSDWQIQNVSTTKKIWSPRSVITGSPYIPVGSTTGHINFCLDPAATPQQVIMRWLDINGDVLCTETLEFECPVDIEGACVVVLNDTITCTGPDEYSFCFDLQNFGSFDGQFIKIHDLHSNPTGGTFTPMLIDMAVLFPQGGGIVTMPCIDIDGLTAGDEFCFVVSVYDSVDPDLGYNNCCHSDTICYIIPDNCPDCDEAPCAFTDYTVTSTDNNEDFCCHSIDIEVGCEEVFAGIELEVLGGSTFRSASSPSDWQIQNISTTKKIWSPRSVITGSPYIPVGITADHIDFCLSPYTAPQQVVMRWLDINGDVLCIDTLAFDCPVIPGGECVVVLNDTITCDTAGHYSFCFDIQNFGDFDGQYIKVHDLHSTPIGGVFAPPFIDMAVNFPQGGGVITMPCIDISGLGAGDEFCFVISVYDEPDPDTGYNNCCHSDTICYTLPPCNNDICENVSSFATSTDSPQDSCCNQLTIVNNYQANFFTSIRVSVLNPGANFGYISDNPNWTMTDNFDGSYTLTHSSGFIPLGTSIPVDYCLANFTTNTQSVEIQWFGDDNGDGISELLCCTAAVTECDPPPPTYPCAELVEQSVYCDDEGGVVFDFSFINNSHLGNTAPGFPITDVTIQAISPTGVSFSPSLINLGSVIAPGATSPLLTTQILNATSNTQVCFRLKAHAVTPDGIECCEGDTIYCITIPACNGCPENLVQNGDFELTSLPPTTIDEDIDRAIGWGEVWPGGSSADLYNSTTAIPPAVLIPALPLSQNNYGSMWCRYVTNDAVWREGMMNQLNSTIAANSGCYDVSFKIACLAGPFGNSAPLLNVYGVPVGATSTGTPTGNTPSNEGLFMPVAIELGSVVIVSTCDENFYTVTFQFDAASLPAGGIDRIFLTRANATAGGAYVAIDDVCIIPGVCDDSGCENYDWGNLNFAPTLQTGPVNGTCDVAITVTGNTYDWYDIDENNDGTFEQTNVTGNASFTVSSSGGIIRIIAYKTLYGEVCTFEQILDYQCDSVDSCDNFDWSPLMFTKEVIPTDMGCDLKVYPITNGIQPVDFDWYDVDLDNNGTTEATNMVDTTFLTVPNNSEILKVTAYKIIGEDTCTHEYILEYECEPLATNSVKALQFSVLPTVTSDQVMVVIEGEYGSNFQLNLFDLNGKPVLKEVISQDSSTRISLSTLPSGMYFLRIQDEEGHIGTKRIIKI